MTTQEFLILCLIGGLAGWLASSVVRGYGAGFFGNIAIGIVGSLLGNLLFDRVFKTQLITDSGLLNDLLTAAVGAVVLLFGIGLISGRRR